MRRRRNFFSGCRAPSSGRDRRGAAPGLVRTGAGRDRAAEGKKQTENESMSVTMKSGQ